LGEAVREFFVIYELGNDNIITQKVWMDILVHKKLRKNIQYNIEDKKVDTNSEYRFLHQYFRSQEENQYNFNFTKDIKKQYSSIINIMNSAELFSDLVFLRNYCSLITFSNVYQSLPFELPIAKLKEIKEKKWEVNHLEFSVYLALIDLLIHQNKEFYLRFKTVVFENFDIWEDEEKVNFMAYLLNFTSLQINKGDVAYIDEQYNLFHYFEEIGIFDIPNYINQGRINNVVFIYLRKKEFQKAEDFVNKYVRLLDEEYMDTCRHFNLARIKFENKQYKESLRELLRVDFSKDAFYSINSKLLLLKNYFELHETDAFESLCASFKEFIRSNKVISDSNKTNYLNFIKSIRKLYQNTPSQLKKLHIEIEAQKQIMEKNWLLEKSSPSK
jgi:hypothetical protein